MGIWNSAAQHYGALRSRSGFRDLGQHFSLLFRRAAQMIFRQAIAQKVEGVFGGVDDPEQLEILRGDGACIHEGVEVDDAIPVFAAIDDDQDLLGQLVGLGERENFEEFVHRAEAAGENDESLGQISEPEFAHEEVVKLEIQRWRDELVGVLLEGQLDVEADALATGLVGAKVGGFHDAGSSAGGDNEAVPAGGNLDGPLGQHVGELARVFVVAGHVNAGLGALQIAFALRGGCSLVLLEVGKAFRRISVPLKARRAEKDNGVLDLLAAKAGERFLIFGEHAENAAIGAVEEGFVLVGYGRGFEMVSHRKLES